MKLTAGDLEHLGIIEQVIPEPEEFTDRNMGRRLQGSGEPDRRFPEKIYGTQCI